MDREGGRLRDVAGAVILGGLSTRMGRDKASLTVGGVPAATRIAEVLAELFEEVLLVGGDPPASAPGRRVLDPPGPPCALRGIVAALGAASAERVLIVATDLPLVTPALLLAIVAWPRAEVVVPRPKGVPQPLCALYQREVAGSRASVHLQAGRLAAKDLLAELNASYLEDVDLTEVDPEGAALLNLNTPQDLARAEALAARPT
jgi:molybdopterin-guanine dinucleotide biosynthesis protein A